MGHGWGASTSRPDRACVVRGASLLAVACCFAPSQGCASPLVANSAGFGVGAFQAQTRFIGDSPAIEQRIEGFGFSIVSGRAVLGYVESVVTEFPLDEVGYSVATQDYIVAVGAEADAVTAAAALKDNELILRK